MAERDGCRVIYTAVAARPRLMAAQKRLSETLSQIPPRDCPTELPASEAHNTNEIAKHSGVGLAWCHVNHCVNPSVAVRSNMPSRTHARMYLPPAP